MSPRGGAILACGIAVVVLLATGATTAATAAAPFNVLFVAMDDLRPVGNVFGEPEVLVPHLDKLASRYVARAQGTGVRPWTSGVPTTDRSGSLNLTTEHDASGCRMRTHARTSTSRPCSSVAFADAFVQSPTCGVSRSSLLTSRRPDTTHVLDNTQCPFTNDPAHVSGALFNCCCYSI